MAHDYTLCPLRVRPEHPSIRSIGQTQLVAFLLFDSESIEVVAGENKRPVPAYSGISQLR